MGKKRRISRATMDVLEVLLRDPTEARHGYDLIKTAGLSSGTLYPILQRLEDEGWVEATWEEIDAAEEGRPRRRYYALTGLGVAAAKAEFRAVHAQSAQFAGGMASWA